MSVKRTWQVFSDITTSAYMAQSYKGLLHYFLYKMSKKLLALTPDLLDAVYSIKQSCDA